MTATLERAMYPRMRIALMGLFLGVLACNAKVEPKAESDEASESERGSERKKKKPTKASEASATASAATASAAPSAAEPASPPSLATMFDGGPALPEGKDVSFGRATLRLPPEWESGGGWDSVDVVERKGGAAKVVLLRLDISPAYLDLNLGTWVKSPFATTAVQWEPRVPGKAGADHLEAQVAKGTGTFRQEEADFWHVATASDGKTYGLVLIAGVKRSAEPKVRGEVAAIVRSARWK